MKIYGKQGHPGEGESTANPGKRIKEDEPRFTSYLQRRTHMKRGIKYSPAYLHDGRLLTLKDTLEFFNLVTRLGLSEEEKAGLVAFMRCL
jgi:hypothetical protein